MPHRFALRRAAALGGASALAVLAPVVATAKNRPVKHRPVKHRPPATVAKAVSFSGSCTFNGATLDFDPGLTSAEADHTATLDANGPCGSAGMGHLTGTVTGKANCTGGQGIANGLGTLTVNGTAIPVRLAFAITLPNGKLTVFGTQSGSGTADAAFLNPNNSSAMPSCAGSGLKHVTFDGKLTTESPITSVVRVPRSAAR